MSDVFYQAMLARDHRFDGKFFIGVKTTGIYCRPICPAKPKRENVEFFPNYLAAERSGYRPCMRCRPESAPQSPIWIGTSAIVRRGIKMIHDEETIRFNEEKFASLVGVSARHLRRVFMQEIGKTPKQIAFEHRLGLARKLIIETALSISEIAFASGFQSVRRFNDAFKDRFKKSPTGIRRNKVSKFAGLKLTLPYRPPFDYNGLLASYDSHRIGQLERIEDGKMYRLVEKDGKAGWVIIENDPENSRLLVEIDFPTTAIVHGVVAKVRALFDLDSDPVVIANSLEADPAIKAILRKHPGIRLPSGWDGFEIAISTILGQLVSIPQARKLTSDLIELLGKDSGLTNQGKSIKLFPTPLAVINGNLATLGTTQKRKKTLVAFAKAVQDKTLSLEPTQDVDTFIKTALSIPGIGPWTAKYIAMKVLRHTDSFPGSDLILLRALELHPKEIIEKMSPWRAYVAALFWREYSLTLKKASKSKRSKNDEK